MEKYSKKYNVILDNMDLNNYHLRPISAIMYLQDAFARFCASKQVAAYDLFPKNMYWVVAGFNIEFTGDLPYWSEEFSVRIWISELSTLKIYTDYELIYKDKIFAKGDALWFLIDSNTKKPAKTNIIADKFAICNEFVLGEHLKFSLPKLYEKCSQITHTNNLSDLDFNKHVNNKSYINLAEMTAPDEFRNKYTLKSLNIKFNKETFLGDTLTCSTYKTDKDKTFVHKIEKDGISVCDILTSWSDKQDNTTILDYNLDVKKEVY